jgi:hypothetical protein
MLRTRRLALAFHYSVIHQANNSTKVIPIRGAHVAHRRFDDVGAGKGRDLRRNAMMNWFSLVASEHDP